MTRRAKQKPDVTLALFPFLAVLVCTMGALIVLLVLVMQQARADAVDAAARRTEQDRNAARERTEGWKTEVEDQTWRGDVLRQQRDALVGQLGDKRLQLAHLERHIREIEQRYATARGDAERLRAVADGRASDIESRAGDRERLEARVAEARRELDDARSAARDRPRQYAIIPYPGPNGTKRRPIYIECARQGIVLRPENVVLRPDDFEGAMGPGNPLDAALRTIREYHAKTVASGDEPYPLLIVRPEGIGAYVAARAAMNAWEDEFGYELVSEELALSFPPPDPRLAAQIEDAVRVARERQSRLRAAMPSFPQGSGFVVSGRGGVVPLGGSNPPATVDGRGSGIGRGPGGAGTSLRNATASPRPDRPGNEDAGDGPTGQTASSGGRAGSPGGSGHGGGSSFPSMAQSRGADWAIDKRSSGPTGYRRPVRVVCQREAIVLMPEPGSNQPPKTFPFGADPAQTLDAFVESLRGRMADWGLAPLGGFWRPRLVVDVAPDAAEQFGMVESLMRDSGLELVRNAP
ncbi:MAG: hypothetical protein FJ297_12390 [Planctomycetes bacterium]|nr:hypothetical protein [Planctomycetota bacterium]